MNLKKIINLSPLVDVMMIVIFWYIMMSNQTIETNKEIAKDEMNELRTEYEAAIDILVQENGDLLKEIETGQNENVELGNQILELEAAKDRLEFLLEQSSSYIYVRLYDGLNKNRMVEVHHEEDLVDKFVFSKGESAYLEQKIKNTVAEYSENGERRVSVIFLYEGNNAFYTDVTQIQSILYSLRSEQGISIHMINIAK